MILAVIFCIGFELFEDVEIRVGKIGFIGEAAAFRCRTVTAVFACKEALGDRIVGQNGNPFRLADGNQIGFDVSQQHIPRVLCGDESLETATLGFVRCLLHLCAGVERATVVSDFAFRHEVLQSAHRLSNRCRRIRSVELVEIDSIGLQFLQTLLQSGANVLGRAGRFARDMRFRESKLGCDEHPVALTLQTSAHERFGLPVSISLGRIQEVDSSINGGIEDRVCLRLSYASTEGVATEADQGDFEASRSADQASFHRSTPPRRGGRARLLPFRRRQWSFPAR